MDTSVWWEGAPQWPGNLVESNRNQGGLQKRGWVQYCKDTWKPEAIHYQLRAKLETGNPAGILIAEFPDLPKFQSVDIL